MTLVQLAGLLNTLGYPLAYSHFDTAQTPPFITYRETNDDDIIADNKNYIEISEIDVELYTIKKDLVAEKKLQDLFKLNEIGYTKYEQWIETEKVFQNTYTINII